MKLFKKPYFLILALAFFACEDDFLSPVPTSAIAADTFYANETELLNGVINMYDGIQGVNALDNSD